MWDQFANKKVAVRCPTCRTWIDPNERCSERNCMDIDGHDGFHWCDVGRQTSVYIWSGAYSGYSCPGRLSLSEWCQKTPGHDGSHNNGKGKTFSDPEPMEIEDLNES